MRVLTWEPFDRWTHGIGLVALVALAWALFVPGGALWTAVLAAGLIGSAVATSVLVRRRSIPTLAQVIARAGDEPVPVPARSGSRSGAGPCARGERKP
jgi:hypothetical protein